MFDMSVNYVNIRWNREKTKTMGIFVLFAVSSIKNNHTDQRESDQTVKMNRFLRLTNSSLS